MKRLLLSSAALGILAGAAYAADIPVYEPAPALAPVMSTYDWSGFYIGPQIGYGWADIEIEDGLLLDESIEADGFFAGGVLGAQWQWNWLVLGAEGELNWSDIDEEEEIQPGNFLSADIDWFGSISGKLGVGLDRVLVYGTGGFAFANVGNGQDVPGLGFAFDDDDTHNGWTAGGGIDFAATNNIIVGVQYRYYDFGDEDVTPPAPFTPREVDADMHTVSGHVTWKFGGGGM